MSDGWLLLLTLISALGCGLRAGFFFSFSVSVMKALGGLAPAQGIAAMQSINVVVINPVFMIAFFGTAVGCLAVAISALRTWDNPAAVYLLAGALLYLVGSFLVTIVFNVPRNNALAAVEPSSAAGEALWGTYLTTWTAWNHVRTAAALAAAATLSIALRL